MGKILDANRAGARSRLRSRERAETIHPAEHFYGLTPGIIHVQCAVNEFRRQNPSSIANVFFG